MTDEKPKNGLFTDYYLTVPNQIKLKVNYKDGKEDGKWTEWHKNGQKKREGNFKDGKKDGKWTWWFESSWKKCEGEYKDGLEVGNWIWWDENGKKIIEGGHKDGKKYLNEVEGLKKSLAEERATEAKTGKGEVAAIFAAAKNKNTSNKGTQTVNKGTQTVKVSDFDMPFVSMIIFMVKWAIASIPAILILMVLFFIFGGLLGIFN